MCSALKPSFNAFRIGDTYPTQHLDVQIRAYLYRWRPTRAADCGKPDVSLLNFELSALSFTTRL